MLSHLLQEHLRICVTMTMYRTAQKILLVTHAYSMSFSLQQQNLNKRSLTLTNCLGFYVVHFCLLEVRILFSEITRGG